jgi:VIT1/CCC1 family predicted Fe2+/Mn2+ transporter
MDQLIVLLIIIMWTNFYLISEGKKPSEILKLSLIGYGSGFLIYILSPLILDGISGLLHKLDDEQE